MIIVGRKEETKNENRNINNASTYKLWRDFTSLCSENSIGKNGA